MTRTRTIAIAAAALALGLGVAAQNPARQQPRNSPLPKVTVYKSPT